jgi:hypothetical protein
VLFDLKPTMLARIGVNYRIETNFRNVRQVIVQGGINDLLQGNRESIGRSLSAYSGNRS